MLRKNLLQWQLETYDENHQNKFNLALHIFAVPLFWLSSISLIYFFLTEAAFFPFGPAGMLVAFIAEGIGHKLEIKAPVPFLGPVDFISRFFIEQFVTYPRWILRKLFFN